MFVIYIDHDTDNIHIAAYSEFKRLESLYDIEYIKEVDCYETAKEIASSIKVINL